VGPARHGDVDFREINSRGKPITLFNYGKMRRDFTYVDDVVESVDAHRSSKPAQPDPAWSGARPTPSRSAAPWRVYTFGNNNPVEVTYVVELAGKGIR
jgi:UDP-glucuronate 4-epimerase